MPLYRVVCGASGVGEGLGKGCENGPDFVDRSEDGGHEPGVGHHTAVAGARKSGFCRMRQPAQTLELEEPGIALDRVEEAKDAVQKRAVGRGLFPGDQIVSQRIQLLVCHVEQIAKQNVQAALAPVTGTRLWTGDGKFRSEERRVEKECVSNGKTRWSAE